MEAEVGVGRGEKEWGGDEVKGEGRPRLWGMKSDMARREVWGREPMSYSVYREVR